MLQEGDVFEIEHGDRVYVDLPGHLWPTNTSRGSGVSMVGDWDIAPCEVRVGEPLRGGPSDFMLGKYVVTRTSLSGGGIGMGLHDEYPSGHYVKAQHVDHPKLTISFYQSGCFTCMLPDKKAIGRAIATWSVQIVDQMPAMKRSDAELKIVADDGEHPSDGCGDLPMSRAPTHNERLLHRMTGVAPTLASSHDGDPNEISRSRASYG